MKSLKKKDLLLFATKLTEKKIENRGIADIKLVIIEHPKTSHKLYKIML